MLRKNKIKIRHLAILGSLLMALLALLMSSNHQAAFAERSVTMTNMELARNGDFSLGASGWEVTRSRVENVGQDGGPAVVMEPTLEPQAQLLQEIHLPDQTSSATFSFDYRLLPLDNGSNAIGQLTVGIATVDSQLATALSTSPIATDTGSLSVNHSLTADEVSAIQSAHDTGKQVYLSFLLTGDSTLGRFGAYVDNVSFQVDGSNTLPTLNGSIAYIGHNADGRRDSIKRIKPDGTDSQTLKTIDPLLHFISDIAWRPDATELAFVSDEEWLSSYFSSDVYAIKPDGSGSRRITNSPGRTELPGSYSTGTVTGRIVNNSGRNVTNLFMYILGASDFVIKTNFNINDEFQFTVSNVADLEAQYIVFTWQGQGSLSYFKELSAFIDVQADQTVDIGKVFFNGVTFQPSVADVTWNADGSFVGFSTIANGFPDQLRKAESTGDIVGSQLINSSSIEDVAWSPLDDRLLYRQALAGFNKTIYVNNAGGDDSSATPLFIDNSLFPQNNPAWLPDGSGFVFSYEGNLHYYDFDSGQTSQLTAFVNERALSPSVSADGRYIVFERQAGDLSDLWILDRQNPLKLWAITNDGRSGHPDWSRTEPVVEPGPTPNPNLTNKLYLPLTVR